MLDANKDRHLPIIAGEAADDAAERAPIVERARGKRDIDDERRPPLLVQMITIARCASGQCCAQRRRPALEVGTRAAHAVAVDHHPGITERHVLAAHRRHDGLIVDAGIGQQHAERFERSDGATFEIEHPGLLLESMRRRKIGAARISDGRNAQPPRLRRQLRHALEPFDAARPQQFGIGHDVGLAHRHEVSGAEIFSDLDLMRDRPLRSRPERARPHRLLFFGELHLESL